MPIFDEATVFAAVNGWVRPPLGVFNALMNAKAPTPRKPLSAASVEALEALPGYWRGRAGVRRQEGDYLRSQGLFLAADAQEEAAARLDLFATLAEAKVASHGEASTGPTVGAEVQE